MMATKGRLEKDSLGELYVPEKAYYGIQTTRASENFPISGLKAHPALVDAIILVKKAAALTNYELGGLDKKRADAIIKACDEILGGKLRDQFIVDVFQMGAGTSFHMNCNEILANRAEEIMGGKKGEYRLVHPNDHVNMRQSTNDVYPTAMRLAVLFLLRDILYPALKEIEESFYSKAEEFDYVLKSGRTHLQDAPPIRLGQEFKAYGKALTKSRIFLENASRSLLELGIGGSAVGTGINTLPGYSEKVVKFLSGMTGLNLVRAEDLIEAMNSLRPMAEVSAGLRNLALEINRISNDLRLLSSGPKTGLAEIILPPVAPGSSIMPGKVNPSMLEMMNMVCYQIIGCDLVVSGGVKAGELELNVMMPVVSFNLNFMIQITGNAIKQLKSKCIDGIQANAERCQAYAEKSFGIAAALSPFIGYDRAAIVVKEALDKNKTLAEVVLEKGWLDKKRMEEILDPKKMTEPL
ncbi:aspartate ammonia-lyase [Acidobacteriota bacterium]